MVPIYPRLGTKNCHEAKINSKNIGLREDLPPFFCSSELFFFFSDYLFPDPPKKTLSEPLILVAVRAQGEVYLPLPPPWPRFCWLRLGVGRLRGIIFMIFDLGDHLFATPKLIKIQLQKKHPKISKI